MMLGKNKQAFDELRGMCGQDTGLFIMVNYDEAMEKLNTNPVSETQQEKRYEELHERADKFFKEVLPQLGNLTIQDYDNLNALGMLLEHPQSGGE